MKQVELVQVSTKRFSRYDVRQEVPHRRPYDLFYAEKIPLLHVFEKAAQSWAGRSQTTRLKQIARFAGLRPPMRAAECGVYRGHSLLACLKVARDLNVAVRFIGLDSFEGLPKLTEEDLSTAPTQASYRNKVLFNDTSFNQVDRLITQAGFRRRVTLVPGFFKETLSKLPENRYDFVNIDCDLYAPHMECLEYFYPRMNRFGIIFFDDYHSQDFPMAKLAIDKFFENKPEKLFHLRFGPEAVNHTKCFLEKH